MVPQKQWFHIEVVNNIFCDLSYPASTSSRSRLLKQIRSVYLRTKAPVHTETFSCAFVLFTVLKGIENNPAHYLKQYKNAGKRFRVYGA